MQMTCRLHPFQVDGLSADNSDLAGRLEKAHSEIASLRTENEVLQRKLFGAESAPERSMRSTPKCGARKYRCEVLDEREAFADARRAPVAPWARYYEEEAETCYDDQYVDEGSPVVVTRRPAPRRPRQSAPAEMVVYERVDFTNEDDVTSIAVTGKMRNSRDRIVTPYLTTEALDRQPPSPKRYFQVDGEEGPDQVLFESDIQVMPVPVDAGLDSQHLRPVRGRLQTPHIDLERTAPHRQDDN
jgi:hypothetical protein